MPFTKNYSIHTLCLCCIKKKKCVFFFIQNHRQHVNSEILTFERDKIWIESKVSKNRTISCSAVNGESDVILKVNFSTYFPKIE